MIQEILTKILYGVMTILIAFGGMIGVEFPMGATVPITVAWFETSLASKITSSATSMTLVSGEDAAENDLDGYMCFTIDEGTSVQEFVCGTASSTAVSSMIRGIDPIDGDLEVSALKKAHRRGASVKVTNYPQLAILSRIVDGAETFPNILEYASANTFTAGSNEIPSVLYVDTVATSGAAYGSYTVQGLFELATTSELALGTATSGAQMYLVVPSDLVGATSSAIVMIPMTDSTGKLSQGFIDLTEAWAFTGSMTFTSSTFSNTVDVIGAFIASSTLEVGLTSTFTGTSTFSAIPTLPASDPTQANQATRKSFVEAYADSAKVLGSWTSTTSCKDAVTQATTDGFVTAIAKGHAEGGSFEGYTDGSNPPTTRRVGTVVLTNTSFYESVTMPVKSGDYWEFNDDIDPHGESIICHWIPLD